jgi:hypothetical protein
MYAPDGCAVRLVDLPYSVGAMVAFDETGYASIYLNARWPNEQRKQALKHELRHIANDDIYNDTDIRAIERRADGAPVTTDSKPPRRTVDRDMATLRRLGLLSVGRDDPLLNLPDYDY